MPTAHRPAPITAKAFRIPARGAGRRPLAWLVMLLLLSPAQLWAQNQRDAERRLQSVRSELKDIGQERRKLEGQRGDASRALRDVDEKVSRSARALATTETQLREQQQALDELQHRRTQMQQGLEQQRQQLAKLLRAAYGVGSDAPLKLLLSQDTVSDANRLLAYNGYLQRARAAQIHQLTDDLQALRQTEDEIAARRDALLQAQQQQQQQRRSLAQDRKQRAALVSQLDARYQQKSDREKALGQDAKALETLLANLRAAAARAEAERRAAERRAAADAAQQARKGGKPTKTPPKVLAHADAPKVGGLSWPVSGSLLARYGGNLPDGHASSGVLIGAPSGTTVTAVADGTVVFSDWMTGYGMILIIDHGNGYMSLYAHNDTLLLDAGAQVKRGQAVAKVGNSGGQGVSALYFELRRNGKPVDPASWLQRR